MTRSQVQKQLDPTPSPIATSARLPLRTSARDALLRRRRLSDRLSHRLSHRL